VQCLVAGQVITLNEVALAALLETQEGPVGRYVQGIAETVVTAAQFQFDEYFHGVLPAEQDIDFRMDGSSATIGYVDSPSKTKTKRIARAEAEGKLSDPPIRKALDQVRGR
jgi:hypothetical protein